ncbi:MAG: Flp/Fap pilin component [Acetobacteraceae bacterium]|jgi:pilus assembly protein Flp/PilA|nr:Flp/Fap pilin component [Acetobacteraceae bacterium]
MFTYIVTWLQLKTDRRAVTAVEYGMIAALIAVAITVTVATLGTTLSGEFTTIKNAL